LTQCPLEICGTYNSREKVRFEKQDFFCLASKFPRRKLVRKFVRGFQNYVHLFFLSPNNEISKHAKKYTKIINKIFPMLHKANTKTNTSFGGGQLYDHASN
jgi:hypothetical protein